MTFVLITLLSVGGWIVPWQHEAGLGSLERGRGVIADVFLFAARLDDDGHPVLEGDTARWAGTVERVHAAGAKAWLTFVQTHQPATVFLTLAVVMLACALLAGFAIGSTGGRGSTLHVVAFAAVLTMALSARASASSGSIGWTGSSRTCGGAWAEPEGL